MPIITVLIYSGRRQKEKNRLAKAFIEDLVKIPEIKKKDIIVVFSRRSSWKLVFFWY
jgi:4-oxalocrotonate tautomerase